MNRREYFKATRSILDAERLLNQQLAIIGVGSGGSRLAVLFAQLGIMRMLLVDLRDELIEERNITRHILGYSWLGKKKLEGVRGRVLDVNPGCEVTILEADVVPDRERAQAALAHCTHILCAVDNEQARHAVNAMAVRLRIPASFAGVFQGGPGGECFLYRPGDACYSCFASYMDRPADQETADATRIDYDRLDEVNQQVIPALNLDIWQIVVIQARLSLAEMLGEVAPDQPLPANLVLFGNRQYEGLFDRPLQAKFHKIPRNPNCLICRDTEGSDEIAAEAARIRAKAMQKG